MFAREEFIMEKTLSNTSSGLYFVFFIAALLILQGCVAVRSFPTIARGGDTITLAVGSPDNMTRANTTAQFVSDLDLIPVDLTIRSIIRLRPDNTSWVANFGNLSLGNMERLSGHSAWLSVIVIDLPQGLSLGPGVININSGGVYTFNGINTRPINIEILAGSGAPNPFVYYTESGPTSKAPGNLSNLEPLTQVVVRPPNIGSGWSTVVFYGAAEIKLNVPVQKVGGGDVVLSDIRVVQDDMHFFNALHQTGMIWSKSGDEITVITTSPTGSMRYYETRFSVLLKPGNEFITIPGSSLTSVTYYDANGNVVTTDTPTVNDFTVAIE